MGVRDNNVIITHRILFGLEEKDCKLCTNIEYKFLKVIYLEIMISCIISYDDILYILRFRVYYTISSLCYEVFCTLNDQFFAPLVLMRNKLFMIIRQYSILKKYYGEMWTHSA